MLVLRRLEVAALIAASGLRRSCDTAASNAVLVLFPSVELTGPDRFLFGPATFLQDREVGRVGGQQPLVGRIEGAAVQHQLQAGSGLDPAAIAGRIRPSPRLRPSTRGRSASLARINATPVMPSASPVCFKQLARVITGAEQTVGQHGQGVGLAAGLDGLLRSGGPTGRPPTRPRPRRGRTPRSRTRSPGRRW